MCKSIVHILKGRVPSWEIKKENSVFLINKAFWFDKKRQENDPAMSCDISCLTLSNAKQNSHNHGCTATNTDAHDC